MSKKRKLIGALLIVLGAVMVFVVGGFIYALLNVSTRTLRWWAGIATVAIPILCSTTFWLGRVEARGRLVGLEQGVSTVMKAAQQTADLRASQIREARRTAASPGSANANPPEIVIVPSSPQALPGGQSGNVLEI